MRKLNNIIQALIIIAILIFLNLISSRFFTRFDLTKEKRYSISKISRNTVDSLNSVLFVKVYLEGEGFPAPLNRLKEAVKTTLIEMKIYAGALQISPA